MSHRMQLSALLLVLAALLLSAVGAGAQAADSLARFVHVVPGAPAVDIYTDGQLTAANLAFGAATPYIAIPAGERSISVRQAGTDSPLWEQVLLTDGGANYTLVASSPDSPSFAVYRDENDLDPLALGQARFTSIHAIADAPAVDILLADGRTLVVNQAYNQPFGTLDIPLFTYSLVIAPAGAGVEGGLFNLELPVSFSGTSYKLVLYGTASNPGYLVLTAPVRAESETGFARVRLVHAVPGAPAVDVYAGGTLIATLTEPADGANATGFIALPAGSLDVSVRAAGTQDDLVSAPVETFPGLYTTVTIINTDSGLSLVVYTDDFSAVTPTQPVLRVTNIGPEGETVSAALDNGATVATDVSAGNPGELFFAPAPGEYTLNVTAGGASLAPVADIFYGGEYYEYLAVGGAGAQLFPLEPVALARGVGSAPASLAVAQAPALPEQPAQPVEPAPQPTVAPPVEPTPAPVIAPPPVVSAGPAFTGRVFNLDPDRNLQLRQYPNAQALSLGTVPFTTVFTVNGREGELAEILSSATQIPPDYEFTDPVELLEDERDDLVRDQTWLFITYDTPDGGQIDAWVRSDYVDVRGATGAPVLLRSLPTVPGNTPGEARNTAITAPAGRQNVVSVRVINMLPTANLNVRRLPLADSEVLARLTLNTVAEFVGIDESGAWAFVRYTAPEGISVTGWASTDFLSYEYNGQPSSLEEFDERGLLQVVTSDTRGAIEAGSAPQIAVPTADPAKDAVVATVALDPGANLNMRRTPDVNAEVIAPILSGTQVVVTARTGDGNWLQVTYEGQGGWIAARTDTAVFVRLSFNGAPYALVDVPLAEGEVDTMGAPAG